MCLASLRLRDSAREREKEYLALGTGMAKSNNEDMSGAGRTLIFEIKRVNAVDGSGAMTVEPRLSLLFEGEEKGVVSAIVQLRRYVIASVGPKVCARTRHEGALTRADSR